jgi:enamine deaminase RidA (YjgF/YER057c/UK114 family)
MKHTRIRPFNTKDTYPEQNLDNDLCQAVVANGVVYIRGPVGQDLDTRENVGVGDLEAQADQAMSNIKTLVEEAGGTMEDIVKVVVYLTDIRFRETVYRTMGKWLKGVYPVSTGIVVSALARPEWLVEIDATAVLSAQARA